MKGGQREAVDRGAADAARRAAGDQGDPPAEGSAQGDDPEGVAVVDAAPLLTAVAGPPQEALKPPIAALASPYGLGPRDDGRFARQPQANVNRGQFSTLDTYPAATGWSRIQPALTRLALLSRRRPVDKTLTTRQELRGALRCERREYIQFDCR